MTAPDLAFVDVETTGFAYWKHDRVVEVGIVRTDFAGNEQGRFETLVNPRRDVGPTHVHGITAEMVRQAPPFEAVADAVLEMLEGTCWVGHNARFDVNFLTAELNRMGDRVEEVPCHCTLRFTRAVYPDLPSKKLERVCEFLDIEMQRAHSALSDAEATRELLAILRRESPGLLSPTRRPFHMGRRVRPAGVEPLSREQFESRRDECGSPLENLLGRLPSVGTGDAGAEAYAYAELLDRILLDRIITDVELEDIRELAEEYDVSRQTAETVHLEYLRNLIRYALLDREISDAERADIRKVQTLLGLEDRDLDSLIEDVRAALDATYAGGAADVADDLRGCTVCFTGALTGTIDGEPISRSTAQRLAHERGMVIKKNVSRKLDYLVAADPHTQSGKAKKARRYEIPIIDEMEFWRKLAVELS